jgi:hypothetical protein
LIIELSRLIVSIKIRLEEKVSSFNQEMASWLKEKKLKNKYQSNNK